MSDFAVPLGCGQTEQFCENVVAVRTERRAADVSVPGVPTSPTTIPSWHRGLPSETIPLERLRAASMVGPVDILEQVCVRARARTGQVASETLGPLTVRDFCRYAVAVGDNGYLAAARSAEADGRPVQAPALFVTGILGWEDGPATEDLYPDGLAPSASPCTDGLPVTQMHGGADVEISQLPTAGSVLQADRRIEGATLKQGRTGPFAVLRLATAFRDGDGNALITCRESIIVTSEAPGPQRGDRPDQAGSTAPDPTAAEPETPEPAPGIMSWTATHVQLFRFSAVSWNAHRIHYDLEFARESGFSGVLVQSTLHGELLARAALTAAGDGARLRRIAWRNRHPAFAGQTLRYQVAADGSLLAVTATGPYGRVYASADVHLDAP